MSRDRLLPELFSQVHKVYKTPHVSTWIAGFFVGSRRASGISIRWPSFRISARCSLSSWFRLGVIVLRKKQPERPRSFRVPLVPLVPLLSIGCCLILMMGLPLLTWLRFFAWLLIGLAIYFRFGKKRSALAV